MPQDGFSIYHIAKELSQTLTGAKINKVSQPDRDEVHLLTFSKLGARMLVLSSNAETCRVSFTSVERPNPKVAPNFCMLLRKHILGTAIESIEMNGFERIIKISFSGRNDFRETVKKDLYVEIMGKYSNLILCENGIILGCLKNAPLDVATTRLTLPGSKYLLPKSQEKLDINDHDSFVKVIDPADLEKSLFDNLMGISFVTAVEFATRCKGIKNIEDIYTRVKSLMLEPEIRPNIAEINGKKDFFIMDYQTVETTKKFFDSLLDGEDRYFSDREKERELKSKHKQISDIVNKLIKKYTKKLQGENDRLLQSADYEDLKLYGELITGNLYRIKPGTEFVELENWYDDNKPVRINMDKNISPNANAQRYFKKYQKEKRTIELLVPQKEETEKELSYLKSVMLEIDQTNDIKDYEDIENELIASSILPKPKRKEPPKPESGCRVYRFMGFVIRCGKNNIQNDRLTSHAFKDDLWLHTKNYHSSHVIIETKGDSIPDKVIEKAAEICAFYSDAKQGTKVPVDYTFKKHVRKPPQAKPGSVIYTDYKTCFVTPYSHDELMEQPQHKPQE